MHRESDHAQDWLRCSVPPVCLPSAKQGCLCLPHHKIAHNAAGQPLVSGAFPTCAVMGAPC
jgi:hypothetical protein